MGLKCGDGRPSPRCWPRFPAPHPPPPPSGHLWAFSAIGAPSARARPTPLTAVSRSPNRRPEPMPPGAARSRRWRTGQPGGFAPNWRSSSAMTIATAPPSPSASATAASCVARAGARRLGTRPPRRRRDRRGDAFRQLDERQQRDAAGPALCRRLSAARCGERDRFGAACLPHRTIGTRPSHVDRRLIAAFASAFARNSPPPHFAPRRTARNLTTSRGVNFVNFVPFQDRRFRARRRAAPVQGGQLEKCRIFAYVRDHADRPEPDADSRPCRSRARSARAHRAHRRQGGPRRPHPRSDPRRARNRRHGAQAGEAARQAALALDLQSRRHRFHDDDRHRQGPAPVAGRAIHRRAPGRGRGAGLHRRHAQMAAALGRRP